MNKHIVSIAYLLFNICLTFAQTLDSISIESICRGRNLVDRGETLGEIVINNHLTNKGLKPVEKEGKRTWQLSDSILLTQSIVPYERGFLWNIELENISGNDIEIKDLAFRLPFCSVDRKYTPEDNMYRHESLNADASYFYWTPFTGIGDNILMTPLNGTAIEFADGKGLYYIHSATAVDRTNDSWRLESTSRKIKKGQKAEYGFKFSVVHSQTEMEKAIYDNGGMNFRVVPGMVVALGQEARFALRCKEPIHNILAEHPSMTTLSKPQKAPEGFLVYNVSFTGLGENYLDISYGNDKHMRVDFFVTEDLGTIIKKRASFIVKRQQHKDTSKWYNGLYSLYNSENGKLLSPDYTEGNPPFMVGGSDDPSNCKPLFISEKNAIIPDPEEIESLEYYERNFVWGKLQRTDEEYPYPYGIYGSDNWWENRSGKFGDYNSGGSGKERMWRTFDYVTHIAIYYNLYRIARDNPSLVTYLDASGYLDRAYNTAMAYFTVPYNIRMGNQWDFHGWCDWAYKQGNFHERYILDLIQALEENGRQKEADRLRREWEKKVTYMIYENPWPFGSEMFVDRTAFESSYYVGEYALKRKMIPQEQFWYDKNFDKWYSYREYPEEPKLRFMQNQLRSNLALRAIHEPSYHMCGAAWMVCGMTLDYMDQMGGVALLDYGTRFAENPADIIRYGYNSLLSSWALVDTSGAAGWCFSNYQKNDLWIGGVYAKRKPFKYDGEIDHGFTGGIHGSGCYIIEDPIFGTVAYGAELKETEKSWTVTMLDGIGQNIAIPQKGHFEMRLESNGFGSPVSISKDLSKISFTIEKRIEIPEQRIKLTGLQEGDYEIVSGDMVLTTFSTSGETDITFNLTGRTTSITIRRR